MKKVTVNDFFCGVGGFGTAFKQAGFDIAGAWDFDKYAIQSYNHNIGNHAVQADIMEMTYKDIPSSNCWTFGFPCVDLSKAKMAKREGLNGKGSGMFYEVMRLLDETIENDGELPDTLLAENVDELAGVLDVVEAEYKKRGYKMYAKLFNSKFWGVPQTRIRWYVVGVHESISKKFEFPIENQNLYLVPKLKNILESNVADLYFYRGEKYRLEPVSTEYRPGHLWQLWNLEGGKGWLDYMKRIYSTEGIICTFNTCQGGGRHAKIIDPETGEARRLTPREYARGQGFPESYEIIVSNSQAYKQFGNAVSVPLAQAVATSIKTFLLSL